jgi:hypothetical protein
MDDNDDVELLHVASPSAGTAAGSSDEPSQLSFSEAIRRSTGGSRRPPAWSPSATLLPPPTFTWSTSTLTPPSQSLYASSVRRHQSESVLSAVIASSGERALGTAQHSTVMSEGHMTYDSFVDGLLGVGERLTVALSDCVAFDCAVIEPASTKGGGGGGGGFEPHWFKRGLAIVTNQRLLMVSASASVINEIATIPWRSKNGKDEGCVVQLRASAHLNLLRTHTHARTPAHRHRSIDARPRSHTHTHTHIHTHARTHTHTHTHLQI